MRTEQYETDVTLKTDGSYFITEGIKVDFLKPRHSIYRNIPVRGMQSYKDKENKEHKLLYYADLKLDVNNINTYASYDKKNGNYQFSYQLTPYHQEKNIIIFITMYFQVSGRILFQKEVGLRYISRKK